MKQKAKERDLHEYDSPIKRADGTVPFNGYLWPTEAWWPGHEPEFRSCIHGQWHFAIVALNDGRFAVDGSVCQIQANSETPYRRRDEPEGRKVVFATRREAIRVAAARMIQQILYIRHNRHVNMWDRMDRKTMSDVINWTLAKVAKACQEELPKPVALVAPPPPPPPRPEAGLPLFEMKPNTERHAPSGAQTVESVMGRSGDPLVADGHIVRLPVKPNARRIEEFARGVK
jgi:hypothetical protein